jgi:hypothetical protein
MGLFIFVFFVLLSKVRTKIPDFFLEVPKKLGFLALTFDRSMYVCDVDVIVQDDNSTEMSVANTRTWYNHRHLTI